ncbi:Type 1 glutamine amidotransferase-like domain-containing protein [Enterococcus sp. LJL90]
MKKLFLASSFLDSYQYLADFAGKDLKGQRLTFIPTASLVEDSLPFLDETRQLFKDLGLVVEELEITTASTEKAQEVLARNQLIFISGGNTYFLLQAIQQKNLLPVLTAEIAKGKLYIGESAGSILAAPTIDYIDKIDDPSQAPLIKGYQGLGEIEIYPLPHVGNRYFGTLIQDIIEEYQTKIPLLPFTDQQAILVAGGEHRLIG